MLNVIKRILKKRSEFENAAQDLEARAEKLSKQNDRSAYANSEVIHSIAAFIRTLGRANKTAERFTLAIAALTFVSVWMLGKQIVDARKIAQEQTYISLNGQFFNNGYSPRIIDAIESKKPILKEHGGLSDQVELDNYLGDFNTIDDAYEDDQLVDEKFCESFSYFVTVTYENEEIKNYLAEQRKEDSSYFAGLDNLYDAISKDRICR